MNLTPEIEVFHMLSDRSLSIFSMGPSIYDVRTEGGGGVSPKEDVVRKVA